MKHIYSISFATSNDSIVLERIKALGNWKSFFPNQVFLETDLHSKDVYSKISVDYENDRILIVKLDLTNYWGIMPPDFWTWLQESREANN